MKRILKRLISIAVIIGVVAFVGYVLYHAVNAPPIYLAFVAGGFEAPLDLASAHDGSRRLFVVDKPGQIFVIQPDGTVNDAPFLDLRSRVSTEIERGLLGLTFSPNYADDGKFYVNYTDLEGDTVVSEFTVSDDPDIANPNSEQELLWVNQPASNHNGGQIVFGPDGYLWTALGDGGGGISTDDNSQDNTDLHGALIRIDVRNYNEDDDMPYDIPPDNPFVGGGEDRAEIWAYGLRNPWRFSFDSATGDLYVGDVGESTYEELNYVAAPLQGGYNFGWNITEGLHCNAIEYQDESCDKTGLIPPVLEYPHEGGNIAITGGFVYRGTAMPKLVGKYLFSDYGSGRIWATSADDGWQTTLLIDPPMFIDSFGVDEQGELYVVDLRTDAIYKITPRTIWQRLIYFTTKD